MWTPKRIVLLAAGFVLFFSGYAVYASFLGGIDGLPPLPECYLQAEVADTHPDGPRKPRTSHLQDRLKQAFGENCKELDRPIRLELHAKRTVLAADQFSVLEDGRMRLQPLSLGLFGADRGDGRGVEINTLHADYAYLTFDRPITNLSEVGNRKVVAAELIEHIHVTNNRRTPARDDDLHVDIHHGPVYYDEAKRLIWTKDDVRVRDDQSKPEPTRISGHGMDMELLAESPAARPGAPAPRKQRGESVTGVKSIVLHSGVNMSLYVDGQSGFPGGTRDASAKPQAGKAPGAAAPAEKARVDITNPAGSFRYEVFKDHDVARFDAPDGAEGEVARSPQYVTAVRSHASLNARDQLVCKHLELRLRRKEGPAKAGAAAAPERGLDIQTARATGPDGQVVLTSDAEKLTAKGSDFFYDATKMETVLKGAPMMEADKDQNVIRARELHIQDHKPAGGKPYQTATGIGPGTVELMDKDATPYRKVMRASWRDTLVSTRDGPHDLLVFTGNASFLDYEHNQTLQADTLKVWLQPREGGPAPAAAQPAPVGARQQEKAPRPDHLEAVGNVLARSAEMHIHDTGRLVVWFKDVPGEGRLPAAAATPARTVSAPAGPAEAAAAGGARVMPVGPAAAPPPAAEPARTGPAPAERGTAFVGPPAPPEPVRPIDLSARSVEAWVLRAEARNTLDKLWTEGKVVVHQAPAKPDEKGVYVEGDTLQMNYRPEGNFLVVTGDLAQLRMDKIYIVGPEVNIDQATNKAWVTGSGVMVMESKTNFQGNELAKPVPLEVHWGKSMLFDGNYAEFHESVQAQQENAWLLCQRLEVHFDRAMSLKEGAKGDQPPARVQTLVCDRNVAVKEETKEGEKLVKLQTLTAPWVSMRAKEPDDEPPPAAAGAPAAPANAGNEVHASGPGSVRLWQAGGVDPAGPGGRRPAAARGEKPGAKPADEMKLTYISYEKRMFADSRKNKADFYANVRVLNFPCTNPHVDVDFDAVLDAMPPGAMYLRCDQMEVLTRPVKGGRSQQELTATGQVSVQTKEFWGRAAKVTFNEEKDQVIFDGGPDGYASLYKVESKGGAAKEVRGKKITYIRQTGEYWADGVKSLGNGG